MYLPVKILRLLAIWCAAIFALSAKAEVSFVCSQPGAPEILGCYFQIIEKNASPMVDFYLRDGEIKVFGDEFLNREYCYSYWDIPAPGEMQKAPDTSLCSITKVVVRGTNYNKHRFPPVPEDKVIFMCAGNLNIARKGCQFSFESGQESANIPFSEELALSSNLIGGRYCAALVSDPVVTPLNFTQCTSQKNSVTARIQFRNDNDGTDFAQYEGPPSSPAPYHLIPPDVLDNPGETSQCILINQDYQVKKFYFMAGEVKAADKVRSYFFGIPDSTDAAKIALMCKDKWFVRLKKEDEPHKISDPSIPTKEALSKEVTTLRRQMKVLRDGYVLHVKVVSHWYVLYQEIYFEAKVAKTTDPNSDPVIADDLKLIWRHGAEGGRENCGKSSICAKSDRIYSTSVFGPGKLCAFGSSTLEGISIGVSTEKDGCL